MALDRRQVPYGVYEWESVGEAVKGAVPWQCRTGARSLIFVLLCRFVSQSIASRSTMHSCMAVRFTVEALACAMLDLHGVTTLSRSSAQALDVLGEAGNADVCGWWPKRHPFFDAKVAARLAAPGVKATTPESLLTANPREAQQPLNCLTGAARRTMPGAETETACDFGRPGAPGGSVPKIRG